MGKIIFLGTVYEWNCIMAQPCKTVHDIIQLSNLWIRNLSHIAILLLLVELMLFEMPDAPPYRRRIKINLAELFFK